jgi:NAD(P)-dependent dehydrogenase (short-subunit alcohol dehydrogenase family)
MSQPVCAIVGVGPGNGAAFARRFAVGGHRVALLARSEEYLKELSGQIGGSQVYPWDATDVDRAPEVFGRIREELGPIDVLVYNAGSGVFANVDRTTLEIFEQAWQVNARGCLVAVQQVLPDMRAAGGGNIVVIGATASLRGGANFLPFSSAKGAQRNLAQALARQLGPEQIHVSYVIVDGVIDIPRTREMLPDRPDEFFLGPDAIAESVYFLTRQAPSAWTFELDLRPFGESW